MGSFTHLGLLTGSFIHDLSIGSHRIVPGFKKGFLQRISGPIKPDGSGMTFTVLAWKIM